MAREGEKSPVLNHRHINDERKYTSPAHLAAKLRPCLSPCPVCREKGGEGREKSMAHQDATGPATHRLRPRDNKRTANRARKGHVEEFRQPERCTLNELVWRGGAAVPEGPLWLAPVPNPRSEAVTLRNDNPYLE